MTRCNRRLGRSWLTVCCMVGYTLNCVVRFTYVCAYIGTANRAPIHRAACTPQSVQVDCSELNSSSHATIWDRVGPCQTGKGETCFTVINKPHDFSSENFRVSLSAVIKMRITPWQLAGWAANPVKLTSQCPHFVHFATTHQRDHNSQIYKHGT
jgi:hypothetical protein